MRLQFSITTMAIIMLYFCVMGAVVAGLISARRWAQTTYLAEGEYDHWQEWKTEAERQAVERGPIKRRPPKSQIPPALELTQNYFGQILGVSLVLTSALFAASVFLIRGMFLSPGHIRED